MSCQFENIPGLQRCARCASLLLLDNVAIEPPRAARGRWRSLFGILRHTIRLPDWLQRMRRSTLTDDRYVDWPLLASCLLPGLPDVRAGHTRIGVSLFVLWGCMLLAALAMAGGIGGIICLNVAMLVHAMSALRGLGVTLSYERALVRALFAAVVFAGLQQVIYGLPIREAGRWYTAIHITGMQENPVLSDGDLILRQGKRARPDQFKRGDLVYYRLTSTNAAAMAAYAIVEGFAIDRIIGVPGDHVVVANGVISVNGQPSAPNAGPLRMDSRNNPTSFDLVAAPDQYIIFPSAVPLLANAGNAAVQQAMTLLSIVRQEDIVGRVVARHWPWSRFRWF